jgi:ADP-ribose pyrophosphatase YjhB (NUDIX family)
VDPRWLGWARSLQAIAQNGLTYATDPFDRERYRALREVAVDIMATHSGADVNTLDDLFANEEGYATPKVDVRGAVFDDDAILLVRERRDGLWTLPGGWADVNEAPSEAVTREVYEESGWRTRAVKLLAVYDRNKHGHTPYLFHVYKLFFQCEIVGGGPAQSAETDAVSFFRDNEIPELSLLRVTPAQIMRAFDHYRHPHWPTDFD